MINKTFNIYCDESCRLENDHKPFMFLGSVSVPYNQVRSITEGINEIKKKHHFYGEIKWTRVSDSKYLFYEELVKYFFETELKFRVVGVEKSKLNNGTFSRTRDEFYCKMYYFLLNHNINILYHYNVYLDSKDTLSAAKVSNLKNMLNTKFEVFRNVQNIRSHESKIMQLTDFLTGAVSYLHNNRKKKNKAKVRLIERIKYYCKNELSGTNYSEKMNLYFVELNYAT